MSVHVSSACPKLTQSGILQDTQPSADPHACPCRLIKAKIKEAGDKPWILVTWAVELPEGALAIAERLGGESKPMLRIRPDGQHLTWRVGCMSRFTEPGRHPKPFFITWDSPDMRPDKVCGSSRESAALSLLCLHS